MTVTIAYLNNGAPVIFDEMPHTQNCSMGVFFTVGSRHETADINGTAHFLEHMAFKGTKTKSAFDLAAFMDGLGAESNAYTGKEVTAYYMKGLGADAVKFSEALGDIVCNSTLPDAEFETERGAIIEEIAMYDDDNKWFAKEEGEAVAYPDQPFGRKILGPKKIIETIDVSVLRQFMDAHYHADNMIVSIAGNVDRNAIIKELNGTLGKLPRKGKSAFDKATYVGGEFCGEKPTEQLSLSVQFESIPYNHDDRAAIHALKVVLGSGMSSRLFQAVRAERGLAYSINASSLLSQDTGKFEVYAGTSADKLHDVMSVVVSELNKIREEGVTSQELVRAKKQMLVGHSRSCDSISDRMQGNASDLYLCGRIIPNDEELDRQESVTTADVQRVANDIFSGVPTVATAGPGANRMPYGQFAQALKL